MRATDLPGLGVAILCLVPRSNVSGQQPAAPMERVGVTCAQMVERRFAIHSPSSKNARFELHFRILPFSGRARQISLIYDLDRAARVRMITFEESACMALIEFESNNGRLPRQDEADSLAQVRTVDLQIEPALAKRWMSRFWKDVAEVARASPQVALTGEANGEVTITLDPNVYEFKFIDEDKSLQLSLAGPDPERVRGPDGLEPLVRWAIDVAQQCESLQKRRAK